MSTVVEGALGGWAWRGGERTVAAGAMRLARLGITEEDEGVGPTDPAPGTEVIDGRKLRAAEEVAVETGGT